MEPRDVPRRSRVRVGQVAGAAVAVVAAAALGGCGGDDREPMAASPGATQPSPAVVPSSPGSTAPAASSPAGSSPGAAPSSRVAWSVVGTGSDGRSLMVAIQAPGNCDVEPDYRVVSSTATRIALKVSAPPPSCGDQGWVTLPPEPIDVGRPLRGQTIEGDGRVPAQSRLYGMPRLIGLGRKEAELVLRGGGQPAPTLRGPRSGSVIAQDPKPGTLLFDRPRVELTLGTSSR